MRTGGGCSTLHPNTENIEKNIGTVCRITHAPQVETSDAKQGSPDDAEIKLGWDEFWRQCPKRVGAHAAFKKYCEVIRSEGATISELLTGMMLYAAAREQVQQPRFDLSPVRWLNDGCWHDDPKAHAVGDGRSRLRDAVAPAYDNLAEREQQAPENKAKRKEEQFRQTQARHEQWLAMTGLLRKELGDAIWKQYFSEVVGEGLSGTMLCLWTRAPFYADKIRKEFAPAIVRCIPGVESVSVRASSTSPLERMAS